MSKLSTPWQKLSKKRKVIIGGVIVGLAAGYLGYNAFMGAATYYYGVGELVEKGSSVYNETVRVNGYVASGSLKQESAGRILSFTLTDVEGRESLPVVYQGVVPDTFKVGIEVVIEGQLNSNGIFQANNIVTKCPSRYVPNR